MIEDDESKFVIKIASNNFTTVERVIGWPDIISEYKKLGLKKAVILSGLMFGLIHLNINQFFYATIIGMVLAVVTLYSRSIFPAMIIHFMNNGLNVYFSFAKARGIFGANFYEKLFSFSK